MTSHDQHQIEIEQNLKRWREKPLLQEVYRRFYGLIAEQLRRDLPGKVVEIGSGCGNLKTVVPDCICTDLFANPWIDQVESAYALSFKDGSVSNLVLFDVFHHLEFPGTALQEFHRVLAPGGRLVIFEPAISLLGWLVYGAFHHEPVGYFKKITWTSDQPQSRYYSGQGNATRVFRGPDYDMLLTDWRRVTTKRFSAISYVASGGYGKPQLYPTSLLPVMTGVDKLGDLIPLLCATRLLVVLEKKYVASKTDNRFGRDDARSSRSVLDCG